MDQKDLTRLERAELVTSLRVAMKEMEAGKSISLEQLEAEMNDL